MNKALLAFLAVVILAIVGVGAFLFTRKPPTNNQTPNNSIMEGNKFSGTFMDLLALGQNYTCTFDTVDDAGTKTKGKVYVAAGGNKLSGQFLITQADGTEVDSNIIRDGEYNYIWTSLQPEGYKTKITLDNDSLFGSGKDSGKSTNLSDDINLDFDCSPWAVDNTMFIPPSNIEFLDLSETMMQLQQESQESIKNSVDCSVCDQAPAGAARDQCLQNLGCPGTPSM